MEAGKEDDLSDYLRFNLESQGFTKMVALDQEATIDVRACKAQTMLFCACSVVSVCIATVLLFWLILFFCNLVLCHGLLCVPSCLL